MLALATAAPGCASHTGGVAALEEGGAKDGMAGSGSAPDKLQRAAAGGASSSLRAAPIAGQGAGGSAASGDDSAATPAAVSNAPAAGSNAAPAATDPMTSSAAPAASLAPAAAGAPTPAAPVAGAPAAGADAAMGGSSGANDPAPAPMGAAAAPDDSVSPCRRDFEQCWGTTGDIPGCAAEANKCGLFPDGPASAMACYTTMTSCFVSTFFDYPECIGRAEDCGLLRPGARACAVTLASCMSGGPIDKLGECFMDAAECGLFPVTGAAAAGTPMAAPGVPGP